MKKLFYIFPAGFLVYGAICGVYYFLQEKIIFHPTTLEKDHTFSFHVPFEEYYLPTQDGETINMIWLKATKPKGVIVYCHGNADNLDRWAKIAEKLVDYSYDVMIFDYRGYGKSTGKVSPENLFTDAQMVYDFAKKQYNENQIICYGRSLGTGIATYIASKNNPKYLVLETPYFSVLEMSQRYANWLPTSWLLKYPIRTDVNIVKVKAPITIFHGTEDEVVPYQSGVKLKPLLKPHDEFVTIPKGMHSDLENSEEYQTGIAKILQ
jgi:alpha-beta hydrolase superfamily lysophospholipase